MISFDGSILSRSGKRAAVTILLALGMACASVGPKTIPRDRFDYGTAISNSWKQQLLRNMVRLRYLEAPVFVDVLSVINQYALEGQVSLRAGFGDAFTGDNTQGVGGAARWADRPTITYSPLSGKEFSRSLMTPITPEALFALVQAGWPPELLLRLTVRSINGVNNATAAPADRRQADPQFGELLAAWGRLRQARALGLRRGDAENQARIIVYVAEEDRLGPEHRDLELLFETLELDADKREFHLRYGLVPEEPDEILVLTASILDLMLDLAWRIEAPPEHVEQGRTGATFEDEDPGSLTFRVGHSTEKPADAYVAIEDRGYWFYIDDRDMPTKRTFAIMQVLLSLTESGDAARGPVVSISN